MQGINNIKIMELLSTVPASVIFAFISFVAAWAVSKYKISNLEEKVKMLEKLRSEDKDTFFKVREKDNRENEDRFHESNFKRELLKDTMTAQIHQIDKKLTEIITIVSSKKT